MLEAAAAAAMEAVLEAWEAALGQAVEQALWQAVEQASEQASELASVQASDLEVKVAMEEVLDAVLAMASVLVRARGNRTGQSTRSAWHPGGTQNYTSPGHSQRRMIQCQCRDSHNLQDMKRWNCQAERAPTTSASQQFPNCT